MCYVRFELVGVNLYLLEVSQSEGIAINGRFFKELLVDTAGFLKKKIDISCGYHYFIFSFLDCSWHYRFACAVV